METLTFRVQGSAPDAYTTTFMRDGTNLTAHCSCPGGTFAKYCKHVLGILQGITKGIVSGNEAEVQTIASWLKGTDVEIAFLEFLEADKHLEEAKKRLDKTKKKLARALTD